MIRITLEVTDWACLAGVVTIAVVYAISAIL